uniref:Uncharacterized protein n=1 Tax=Ciona intestinalis TaxID=7719 RepID=H2XX01_CIOIN
MPGLQVIPEHTCVEILVYIAHVIRIRHNSYYCEIASYVTSQLQMSLGCINAGFMIK